MSTSIESPTRFHIFKTAGEFFEAKKGEIDQGRVFLKALTNRLISIKEKCEISAFCAMVHPLNTVTS